MNSTLYSQKNSEVFSLVSDCRNCVYFEYKEFYDEVDRKVKSYAFCNHPLLYKNIRMIHRDCKYYLPKKYPKLDNWIDNKTREVRI